MAGLEDARVWQFTRAGSIEPNAMTVTQRASAFTSATPDGTVLLTRRDEDGLHHYLVLPPGSRDLSQTFSPLAHAVAAVSMNALVDRPTQAGADVSELSKLLAEATVTVP